jgi:hypothetical protein
MGYSTINSSDASYYNNLNFKVNLLIGIFTGLVTVGFGGILYFVQHEENKTKIVLYWISTIMSLILNVCIMILTVYSTIKNPVSKITTCSVNAAKFGSLYRQIIGEFAKDPNDREDALTLHEHVLLRFNELESEKPFLRDESKALWDSYTKEISNHPQNYSAVIKLPEEFVNDLDNMNNANTRDFNFKSSVNKTGEDYNDSDILLVNDSANIDKLKQIFANW